jgi:hypothetical protein
MSKKNIVVVTNLQKSELQGLKNHADYDVTYLDNDEAAIELFHQRTFELVVVDETDKTIDHKKLKAILPILYKEVVVLAYKGESLENLELNIREIYRRKSMERVQRLLILDASEEGAWNGLPVFSVN